MEWQDGGARSPKDVGGAMAFEDARAAFAHSRTQIEDEDVPVEVIIEGLMSLLDEAEEEIQKLKADVAMLKAGAARTESGTDSA
jgi:hypothetical protein